jgi:hypothetical protein
MTEGTVDHLTLLGDANSSAIPGWIGLVRKVT